MAPSNTPLPPTSARGTTRARATDEEIQAAMAGVSDSATRTALADTQRGDGHLVNLSFLPQIPGKWHWLEPGDEILAHSLGYEDQIDVTGAREQQLLTDTVDNRSPCVVWIPHSALWNPAAPLETPGHFEYFGNISRDLAWTNFGSSEKYEMQDEARPTAAHIQHLRQRLFAERGDYGPTEGIDIVYVPDNPDYSPPPSREPSPAPRESEEQTTPSKPLDKNIWDLETLLKHDPTNGGDQDQTGTPEHLRYRTTIPKKGSKQVTADISPAAKDRPELHKLWCPNQKGKWVKWAPRDIEKVDWANAGHLKRLNAWRDQSLSRAGFGYKRDGPRDDYTPEQKKWLFDNHIAHRKGTPPGVHDLSKIKDDFNEHFNAGRTQAGLSAVCARLAKMWKDHGQFVLGPVRGQAQRERRRAREREREREKEKESDEESTEEETEDETTNVQDETQVSDDESVEADEDEDAEGDGEE